MPANPPVDRRFSPTVTGIVTVTFIRYLAQHPRLKWICIVLGVTILLSPLIWFVGLYLAPDQFTWLVPAAGSLYASIAGLYLLYICALASPDYHVFVAPAPEVADRERAEEVVRESPTPRSVLELDSARLTEYYAINQSQARSSFRWAIVAFLLGFGTILCGIWLFYFRQESRSESMTWLTTIAGVVTNAVAAMFLYLYNKTHERSLYYYNQLARVQMIDLAIRLVESHGDETEKTKAKNKVIAELLTASHAIVAATPGKRVSRRAAGESA
jgi:hypothetical protein